MAIIDTVAGAISCPNCKKSGPPFNFRIEQRVTLRKANPKAAGIDTASVIETATFYVCTHCGEAFPVK